jgi:beta-phosphoglucomutase-like phosphatase (HAD superfamily)
MTIDRPDDVGQEASLFRAVLWDIDGTLLLSESMHFRAFVMPWRQKGSRRPMSFIMRLLAAPRRSSSRSAGRPLAYP